MRFFSNGFRWNVKLDLGLRWSLIAVAGVVLSGCTTHEDIHEFFARKPTELESKLVIRDIAQVRENPHIYNPLPEMYRTAPRRLHLDDGVRMFYFTKHHPAKAIADDLKKLGFKVSQNPSTNQVINDKEFAGHEMIATEFGCDCFFAKPYHSWERGANETRMA